MTNGAGTTKTRSSRRITKKNWFSSCRGSSCPSWLPGLFKCSADRRRCGPKACTTIRLKDGAARRPCASTLINISGDTTPREYGWIDDSMAALRRDFLPAGLAPRDDAAPVSTRASRSRRARPSRKRGGCSRSPMRTRSSPAWSGGSICRRRTRARRSNSWPPTRSSSACATSCRASPTIDFCCARSSAAGSPCSTSSGSPTTSSSIVAICRWRPSSPAASRGSVSSSTTSRSRTFARGEIRAWSADVRTLAACPNVWCKLSGLVTEADWAAWTPEQLRPYLDVAFDGFGADRLMIGSDWPVCTVASDYARTMAVVVEYLARAARARTRRRARRQRAAILESGHGQRGRTDNERHS